jgi:hypothetical protein
LTDGHNRSLLSGPLAKGKSALENQGGGNGIPRNWHLAQGVRSRC